MNKEVLHYFKTVPSATEAFTTSDGTVFTHKHYAESFSKELKDHKVEKHERKDFEDAITDAEATEFALAEAAKEKALHDVRPEDFLRMSAEQKSSFIERMAIDSIEQKEKAKAIADSLDMADKIDEQNDSVTLSADPNPHLEQEAEAANVDVLMEAIETVAEVVKVEPTKEVEETGKKTKSKNAKA